MKVKEYILKSLIDETEQELTRAKSAHKMSQDDANEAEGAMISRYDTFKEEAQYLAGAQKLRMVTLESGLKALEQLMLNKDALGPKRMVVVGSIVRAEIDEQEKSFFLAPFGGGKKIIFEKVEFQILTPDAPLAKAIWHKYPGDDAIWRNGSQVREIVINSIE